MSQLNFLFSSKKPTNDKRDFIYENIFQSNISLNQSKICDYRNQLLPVRNQGSQGTCYAQVATCVKEWQENKFNLPDISYFSPQFIYNHRNYWNNNQQDGEDLNEDYGMEGRDVMRILKQTGVCDESRYHYGTIETVDKIPNDILIDAKKNIIKGYSKIITLDGLKNSLLENGPCLIAFPVYNYSPNMWLKNENDVLLGGHAMTVVGYDDNKEYFIIRNSWGEEWGDKGYTYYKYSEWPSHWECWTTIDDITNNLQNTHIKFDLNYISNNLLSVNQKSLFENGLTTISMSNPIRIKSIILNFSKWDYNENINSFFYTLDKDLINYTENKLQFILPNTPNENSHQLTIITDKFIEKSKNPKILFQVAGKCILDKIEHIYDNYGIEILNFIEIDNDDNINDSNNDKYSDKENNLDTTSNRTSSSGYMSDSSNETVVNDDSDTNQINNTANDDTLCSKLLRIIIK